MKKSVITIVVICVAAVAATIVYSNRKKPLPPPAPVVESSTPPTEPATPEKIVPPKPEPPRVVASEPKPAPVANPVAGDLKPAVAFLPHSKAVDTLVSAQTGHSDRWALLNQLKKLGELDAAIAELKQRTLENPNDAEIQTALGEAIMAKFPVADFNEAATLGLQIDQSFDAALKNDPNNWQAQYEKAHSMSYWPDVAGDKGPEIIQRLSGLVDQQEALPPQPQFAKTYILLGEQYKKAGQTDQALATWQLGLQKFPNDPALLRKISGQ
jgi:tetratricopeptide (TPR) repeat protein